MRPETLNPLFADAAALPGAGPATRRQLERLDISRVRDLLFHWPIGWRHTRAIPSLDDAVVGERVALTITITSRERARGRAPARLIATDQQGGSLELLFFGRHADGLASRFPVGEATLIAGRIDQWNGRWRIAHPELAEAGIGPEPVYPLTEGMTSRKLATLCAAALARLPDLPEWIEPSMLARSRWPGFAEALRQVHQAADSAAARDRLAYDEMLASQLAWALVRARRRRARAVPLEWTGDLPDRFAASLPFALTGAQQRAIAAIAADVRQPAAMLRLLQGDVGSGKTAVAVAALLMAVASGAQGALLAPTDLLARQHYASLQALLKGLPVRLGFLSGREKGRARTETLAALEEGRIDILIGTHAIFMSGVRYQRLALAVVDEQHRFGVAQRLMLQDKGERPPHLLVMTATPIPRTLALASFGEMDVSVLDERPPGHQPVETRVMALSRLPDVVDAVARHLASGAQAYWVCPLVDGGDLAEPPNPDDAAPAVTRAAALKQRFGATVELVHGRMTGAERDAAMDRFIRADAQLLVATTVIEVGVDVPNASLMVIEGAERFGLAQLHQLRGRVGRGSQRSVCLLLRSDELSETARARLAMLRDSDDGFAIAEADLKLRGPGELMGTRQSGEQGFRLATPDQVDRLLGAAQADARLLIERDGGLGSPRGDAARHLLYLFDRDSAVATLKSG